jgi:hypothetical protein
MLVRKNREVKAPFGQGAFSIPKRRCEILQNYFYSHDSFTLYNRKEMQFMVIAHLQTLLLKNLKEMLLKKHPELKIIRQFIPNRIYPVNNEIDKHYPFLVVRAKGGYDGEEESSVKIEFVFGSDSKEDGNSYEMFLSILEDIRQHYGTNRFLESFEMDKKLSWRMQDKEDYYPYFYGYISTVWNIPSVIEGDELI